jgi:hypothetical protein
MSRLFAVAPDPQLERALLRIRSAADSGFGRDPARMAELVRESGIALGPGFEWLLGAMEAARD